jgi:hypothetical protein
MISMTHDELRAADFYLGAAGQWYCNSGFGNRDNSDNHAHLMGQTIALGYDPVTNPTPTQSLTIERIELKLRCPDRGVQRVWLIRHTNGKFAMPISMPGLNRMELLLAREMYDMLPEVLRA